MHPTILSSTPLLKDASGNTKDDAVSPIKLNPVIAWSTFIAGGDEGAMRIKLLMTILMHGMAITIVKIASRFNSSDAANQCRNASPSPGV